MRLLRDVLIMLACVLLLTWLMRLAAYVTLLLGVGIIVWFGGCEMLAVLGVLRRKDEDDEP
jgi:hypothetical protein